jgi:hypothetical protein
MLVSQVNAKVLAGTTLADRPDPGLVPEDNVLFVDLAMGEMYILMIDPITHVHSWLLIGGGGTQNIPTGPATYKFAGGFLSSGSGEEDLSLADDSETDSSGNARADTVYVSNATTSNVRMSVDVISSTLSTTSVVQLLKNGVVVLESDVLPGLTPEVDVVGGAIPFAPTDTFEVNFHKNTGGISEQAVQLTVTVTFY